MSSANLSEEKKVGVAGRIGRGFRNMKGEMSRVVWPSKKQVLNNTGIVLGFMAIAAMVIGGFDALLSLLARAAFGS